MPFWNTAYWRKALFHLMLRASELLHFRLINSQAQTQLNLSLSFTHSVGLSISRRNILQIILEGGVKSWQRL